MEMGKSRPAWEGAFVIEMEGATGNKDGSSPPHKIGGMESRKTRNENKRKQKRTESAQKGTNKQYKRG
jgi:hypothetical protein